MSTEDEKAIDELLGRNPAGGTDDEGDDRELTVDEHLKAVRQHTNEEKR